MTEHVERWRLAAAEWLDAQEAADLLRETKNDVFAEIVADTSGSSNAEKERNARLTSRWREYRDQMIAAEGKARRLKFRVKYAEMEFDAWRTQAANNRTERKQY